MGIDVKVVGESADEIAALLDARNLTKQMLPDVSDSGSCCLRFINPKTAISLK